ncbi:Multidrug resistance efflux pump-like protein [Methylobacterium sp. 4-46]|uniref:HlyD family secretion protein n=1 Tax=unclassified Methylobacterium TaxID=2615210 RepID=UPI000165C65C|nr:MULTISPECIES: HlyD family efflux transporter periplasmic adaptor subunit [Methylobacterium]ACA17714.1 Multidrug resistance efflux pump-like protein [Methylobacterium sp. 4-46]WFT83384.1 HlyD family efflux transporter periplasmic adaptor subunit [Methylobacterium nodulans]
MSELKVSQMSWGKLFRVLVTGTAVIGSGAIGFYYYSSGVLVLNADGLVTRDRVYVATPYDARVREVFVRPGDTVVAGQKIAVVDSPSISKTLAEFSIERAKISSRVAQLEARTTIVAAMVPVARAGAKQANEFMADLNKAKSSGLALNRSLHEVTAASFTATERLLTMISEKISLDTELASNRAALAEITSASDNLRRVYADGVLTAPVSGVVGSAIASPGEVLTPGSNRLASIYTGTSFVLAYMPESYLFEAAEGQSVQVSAHRQSVSGQIARILPVTDALPPEFQPPNRARDRGQVVKISLNDADRFAVDQKIRVSSCIVTGCKESYVEQAKARVILTFGNLLSSPAHAERIKREASVKP